MTTLENGRVYKEKRLEDWRVNANFWADYVDSNDNRRRLHLSIVNQAKEVFKNPQSICDIGCGEGLFLRLAWQVFQRADLYGSDFCNVMLDLARKRSGPARIEFTLEDWEETLFPPRKYDLINASLVADEISDISTFFDNIVLSLSEKGVFILTILDPITALLRNELLRTEIVMPYMVRKNFYISGRSSPAPYCLIIRGLDLYLNSLLSKGLDVLRITTTEIRESCPPEKCDLKFVTLFAGKGR